MSAAATGPAHPRRHRRAVPPTWVTVGPFVTAVLGLSATQFLPELLPGSGSGRPWLAGATTLLGGGLAPTWALLLAGTITIGWRPLRRRIADSLDPRGPASLYLTSLALPPAVLLTTTILQQQPPGTPGVDLPTLLLPVVVVAPVFALAEQLGWRVWLQTELQRRFSVLPAGLGVGLVWAAFHLPLLTTDHGTVHAELPLGPYTALVVSFSLVLAAVFNLARGRVLPAVVAHVGFNAAMQLLLPATPDARGGFLLTAAALFLLTALALTGSTRTSRRRRRAPNRGTRG